MAHCTATRWFSAIFRCPCKCSTLPPSKKYAREARGQGIWQVHTIRKPYAPTKIPTIWYIPTNWGIISMLKQVTQVNRVHQRYLHYAKEWRPWLEWSMILALQILLNKGSAYCFGVLCLEVSACMFLFSDTCWVWGGCQWLPWKDGAVWCMWFLLGYWRHTVPCRRPPPWETAYWVCTYQGSHYWVAGKQVYAARIHLVCVFVLMPILLYALCTHRATGLLFLLINAL